jgi:hypothetical protein
MKKARWWGLLLSLGVLVLFFTVTANARVAVSSGPGGAGSQAEVSSVPELPHAFYGAVTVNGVVVPLGAMVEARGAGVLSGVSGNPIAVSPAGQYGGAGAFDPKLIVQGTITDGTAITFYVDGVAAQCAEPNGVWLDSYPFKSGAVTQLNLRVEVATPTPTPTPTSTSTYTPTSTPTATPTNTPTPRRLYLPIICQ